MCGRFTRDFTWEQVRAFSQPLPLVTPAQDPIPNYNRAPTQEGWAIVQADSGGIALPMRWGLLPPWARDTRLAFSTINARLESVADKPAFRGAWKQRRALIPASGYYEWPVIDGRKRPHFIRLDGAPVLMFGGVWESRPDGAGGE